MRKKNRRNIGGYIRQYAYMVILILSVLVASPLIIREVWRTQAKPAANMSSETKKGTSGTDKANDSNTPEEKLAEEQEPSAETPDARKDISGDGTTQGKEDTSTDKDGQEKADSTDGDGQEKTDSTELEIRSFVQGDASYFDDALFIGDSRTVGLHHYGTLKNANYYADDGMLIRELDETVALVPGGVSFETMLTQKEYGKVYIMMGINELEFEMDETMKKIEELVARVQEKQPKALIFLEGNMHVTKARSESDSVFNNERIDMFNSYMEALADGQTIFYIDVNEVFDDAEGNLIQEYSGDNTHVYAKYYKDWSEWLCSKTIQ